MNKIENKIDNIKFNALKWNAEHPYTIPSIIIGSALMFFIYSSVNHTNNENLCNINTKTEALANEQIVEASKAVFEKTENNVLPTDNVRKAEEVGGFSNELETIFRQALDRECSGTERQDLANSIYSIQKKDLN